MSRNFSAPAAFSLLALFSTFMIVGATPADDATKKEAPKKDVVGGLLIDWKDDGVLVRVDGEEEPTKFLWGNGIDKQTLINRHIFNVNRVNVKFKADGDKKTLVAIERVTGKPQGVIVGEVLKVYNDFWVAVKPKQGNIDGFALNFPPEKFKQSHDLIKTLQPGDIVAIKYATDFERHRILEMQVKPAPTKPADSTK